MWQKILPLETGEYLKTSKSIDNLTFKDFTIDPTGGNLVELVLSDNVKRNMNDVRPYFRRGVWVDMTVDDARFNGFVTKLDTDSLTLRIKDLPPSTISDRSNISVSLPDDRYVMDFLLELWKGDDWRKLPGAKNFLRAHYALEITFGRPRGKVVFVNKVSLSV